MRIKAIFKWVGIVLGGIVGIIVIAAVTIYVYMGSRFGKTFDIAGTAVAVPDDDASIAEGGRLAKLRGCNGGCHGEGSRGQIFFKLPGGTQIVAPNIVRAAQNYSIEDFERVVRHGVRPDGTSVIRVMPANMFYNLSDEDFGKIVAFMRSRDVGDEELAGTEIRALGRLMLFYYKQLIGTILTADVIDHGAQRFDPTSNDPVERGRYLGFTVCSECHGEDLRGASVDMEIPDLAAVAAYPLEEFRKLMRTGVPLDGRELGMMADVVSSRFSHFTDGEIDDLHGFLQTLAAAPREP